MFDDVEGRPFVRNMCVSSAQSQLVKLYGEASPPSHGTTMTKPSTSLPFSSTPNAPLLTDRLFMQGTFQISRDGHWNHLAQNRCHTAPHTATSTTLFPTHRHWSTSKFFKKAKNQSFRFNHCVKSFTKVSLITIKDCFASRWWYLETQTSSVLHH